MKDEIIEGRPRCRGALLLGIVILITFGFWAGYSVGYRYVAAIDSRFGFVTWVDAIDKWDFENSNVPKNYEILASQFYWKLDKTPKVISILLRFREGEYDQKSREIRSEEYDRMFKENHLTTPWETTEDLRNIMKRNNF